jgi:hypothetical protein
MPTKNSRLTDEALLDLFIELTEQLRVAVEKKHSQVLIDALRMELQSVQNELSRRSQQPGERSS